VNSNQASSAVPSNQCLDEHDPAADAERSVCMGANLALMAAMRQPNAQRVAAPPGR
jgi:hypothetical protein